MWLNLNLCSIIKKAEQEGIKIDKYKEVNIRLLDKEEEIELIKKLSSLKEVVKSGNYRRCRID